jgi:hypothetical protein
LGWSLFEVSSVFSIFYSFVFGGEIEFATFFQFFVESNAAGHGLELAFGVEESVHEFEMDGILAKFDKDAPFISA